jgi:hypothetical protein
MSKTNLPKLLVEGTLLKIRFGKTIFRITSIYTDQYLLEKVYVVESLNGRVKDRYVINGIISNFILFNNNYNKLWNELNA